MPSATAMPRRSFGGEIVIGAPLHTPSMILALPSAFGALSPSAVRLVRWTPFTIVGGTMMPGSGSSAMPNAAIIAAGYGSRAGKYPSVAGIGPPY
jgi:hypothetical protein